MLRVDVTPLRILCQAGLKLAQCFARNAVKTLACFENVPFWNVLDWHCVPFWKMCHSEVSFRLTLCKTYFVISKPHVNCKGLKHKLCKETKSKVKLLHSFVCLFFSNECRATSNAISLIKKQTNKNILLSAFKVCTVSIWNMFQNDALIFWNGTEHVHEETCYDVMSALKNGINMISKSV